jgi:hypothetical protein
MLNYNVADFFQSHGKKNRCKKKLTNDHAIFFHKLARFISIHVEVTSYTIISDIQEEIMEEIN